MIFSGNIVIPVNGEIINIAVDPGEQIVIPIADLTLGDFVTGTINIRGGGNEIKYWVIDPDGNTVLHLGPVVQGKAFEFFVQTNGLHSARLDNRESTATKSVTIEYYVQIEEDSLDIYYWGKILGVLLIAIFIINYLYVRMRKGRARLTI